MALPSAASTTEASERLASGVAVAVAVLVVSSLTVLLNEMLMAKAIRQ